jgi:signal transduction histidine kinase
MRFRWLIADAALALVLAAGGVARLFAADLSGEEPSALAIALTVLTGAVLVVRRRWPLAVLAVAAVATAAYLLLDNPYGPSIIAFAVAVYTVARHRPIAQAAVAAVLAEVIFLSHVPFHSEAVNGFMAVTWAAGWVVVPFVVGVTVRVVREAGERARAEAIRHRVDEERLRVAQEVHDIVGHGLAAIKMQAEVALHVLPKRPEQASVALETISRTSGEALQELRSTLEVVRAGGADQAPGLARLEELRDRMRGAGLQVHVETVGEPRPLSPAVDLTAYRVLQESLTNVLRHSGANSAEVSIRYRDDAVELVVSNPVTKPVREGEGLGIPGMRHRVHAVGGEFSVDFDDGQFTVHALLPTGDAS